MKVAFVTEPYKVKIEDLAIPEISSNEVLIKVKYAGVCGSDLHLYKGTHAFRKLPASLGHEVSGTICKIGSAVTKFQVGDRVTIEPQVGCGKCAFCMNGHTNLCKNKKVPGTPAWIGTFAEYFNAKEQTVYKLSDAVSLRAGTLVEPLAVAVQALNRIEGASRNSLAILGCGTIGLLVLIVAKHRGYQNIYCTDTAPFNRELAIKLGATAAYDPLNCDIGALIKQTTEDNGVDACVVAAAANNIIDQASSATKKLGEIVLVSMITNVIPVYTYSIVFNEQKLIGSMTYTKKSFAEACEMVNNGLGVEAIITHDLRVEDAGKALEILDKKSENAGKILIHM